MAKSTQTYISKKGATKASRTLRTGATPAMRQVASREMNMAKKNSRTKKAK